MKKMTFSNTQILRRLLLVSFMITGLQQTFAQKIIVPESKSIVVDNNSFYIEKVIDKRNNTSSIGSYTNEWDEKITLELFCGLPQAIYDFYNESFSQSTNKQAIAIEVNKFDLSVVRSSVEKQTIRIVYDFQFYNYSDSTQSGYLFSIQSYNDSVYNEYSAYAGVKLEDFISICISETLSKAILQFANKTDFSASNTNTIPQKMVIIKPKPLNKWVNIITCNRSFSKHQKGWKLSYYGYQQDPTKDYFMPYVFSYNMSKGEGSSLESKGIKSVNTYDLGTGSRFLFNLSPQFYGNIEFQIPLGWESIKYTDGAKKKFFLYGLSSTQGVYFIGKNNEDLVLGINIYERFVKSKITPNDFGFSVELGIKF